MAERRLELHEELCDLLESRNVYFNPPESMKLSYECILYKQVGVAASHANNKIYRSTTRYEVTHISDDPDSSTPDKILNHFSMCSFDRGYVADNLYHKVYTIYY